MSSKKTLVLGATTNPNRYAYLAANKLVQHGHEIVLVGIKHGTVAGATIFTDLPTPTDIDTVTLYLNPQRQQAYYNYLLLLHPKRIIFNPGTENDELVALAQQNGIATEEACTLVLLNTNQY